MRLTITREQIKAGGVNQFGEEDYSRLLNDKNIPEDVPLLHILDAYGLDLALWCLTLLPEHENKAQSYTIWLVRQAGLLSSNIERILETAEAIVAGKLGEEEAEAAWEAAKKYAESTSRPKPHILQAPEEKRENSLAWAACGAVAGMCLWALAWVEREVPGIRQTAIKHLREVLTSPAP